MSKHFYFFLLFALASIPMWAQTQTAVNREKTRTLFGSNMTLTFDNRYEGVQGEPYQANWQIGTAYFKGELTYDSIDARVNLHKNDIEVRFESGQISSVHDGLIVRLQFTTDDFYYVSADTVPLDDFESSYLNLVRTDNNMKVYEGRKFYIQEADLGDSYSSGKRYDEFKELPPIYYLNNIGGNWVEFRLGKKHVLSLMMDRRNEMKSYIKTANLDLSMLDDALKLIQYYQSL